MDDVAAYEGDLVPGLHPNESSISPSESWAGVGEVQCWNGHWMLGTHKGLMTTELFFADNQKVYGGGSDEVGEFTWAGERQGNRVHMMKQYIEKHQLEYDGEVKNNTMEGTWRIGWASSSGAFHLKQQPRKSVAKASRSGVLQVGEMQHWTGYYKQSGRKSKMSMDMLFTDNLKIYGSGTDTVGRFTWLGHYHPGSQSTSVDMTKQYEGAHSVHYHGAIAQQHDRKLAMEGSWEISGTDKGPFFLQPQVTSEAVDIDNLADGPVTKALATLALY